MWKNYITFSVLISATLASIHDYDLGSFTNMCRDNVRASLRYSPRKNNKDLLEVEEEERDTPSWGVYDYIIVGAGSAGTLLANRLSEDSDRSLLLLEAGGPDNDFSDIPGMTQFLSVSDMDWGYRSTSQKYGCFFKSKHLKYVQPKRKCVLPRGKVRGGSSTINAKMYVRGNKEDYNGWADMGNVGWSSDEVLPYFKKTENNLIPGLDAVYHSTGGLLDISYVESTLYKDIYLDGMKELGYNVVDFNGANQIGVGRTPFTLNRDAIASGARAFLDPIIDRRKNLEVLLRAFVTKLIIDKNTKLAIGVEFVKDGKRYTAEASLEVILSAGSYNSPQLLLLSGIGPKYHLDHKDIKVVHELPAVGQHLQDHIIYIGFLIRTNQTQFRQTFNDYARTYFKNRSRPWAAPFGVEAMGFFPVHNVSSSVPDIQHILTVPPGAHAEAELSHSHPLIYDPYRDMLLQVILIKPNSRGSVTLDSDNPKDFPIINPRYFTDPDNRDLETLTDGVMETLKLLKTKAFKSVKAKVRPLLAPLCEGAHRPLSRNYFRCAIKKLGRSAFHPCGTCRMGIDVEDSVVSPDLKVHGIFNLRVVDASVFPDTPSANLNAPVYMLAEKAADIIKEQNALKRR